MTDPSKPLTVRLYTMGAALVVTALANFSAQARAYAKALDGEEPWLPVAVNKPWRELSDIVADLAVSTDLPAVMTSLYKRAEAKAAELDEAIVAWVRTVRGH